MAVVPRNARKWTATAGNRGVGSPQEATISQLSLKDNVAATEISLRPGGATRRGFDASAPTDIEALVTTALPLVRHIVADTARRVPAFVDRDDLMAAGMLGLTQAARSYRPSAGVSFPAFARTRIRGAVLDELRGRDPMTRRDRRRAQLVSATSLALHEALGRRPTHMETASHLGVDVTEVRRACDDIARAAELERSTSDLQGSDAEAAASSNAGPLDELLAAELRGYLIDAVAALPIRLRDIIVGHFLDGREIRDIATELGVTPSRVSQLCARAIALLRDGLNAQLDPDLVDDLEITTGRVARAKHDYYRRVAEASAHTRSNRRTPDNETAAA